MEAERVKAFIGLLLLLVSLPALAGNGFVRVASQYDFDTTVARFQQALSDKGIDLVVSIDHAAAAKKVGKTLLPTTVLVFGNPNLGTPLMQQQDTAALDLPMRMLIKENTDGSVQLVYRDPAGLQQDHGELPDKLIQTMQQALASLTAQAAQ